MHQSATEWHKSAKNTAKTTQIRNILPAPKSQKCNKAKRKLKNEKWHKLVPLLSLHRSSEISTFFLFSIEASTFSSAVFCSPYFLFTLLLKFYFFLFNLLLKSLFSLSYWNPYFLVTFLLVSQVLATLSPPLHGVLHTAPPSEAHDYTASSNVRMHSPKARCHHLKPALHGTYQSQSLQGV